MREDLALESARNNTAPMQIKAIESTADRGSNVIAVPRITGEQPDLLLSFAKAKFCQTDRVLRQRCLRPSTRRCRSMRARYSPKSSSQRARRFHARFCRDAGQPQRSQIFGWLPVNGAKLIRNSAARLRPRAM